MTDEFLAGKRLAELKGTTLKEISGLAASKNNKGLLWAINDSGNGAEIFLLDENLDIKLTCTLGNAHNRDWEDMTVGPGPEAGKTYVYVGDIGDNEGQFKEKYIYRFEEPTWTGDTEEFQITDFDTITFELPDGRKDTETLFIDPKKKDLYIISKRESPVYLYKLSYPQSAHGKMIAEEIMSLPFTKIVSGAMSNNGSELLIKDYDHIYFWSNTDSRAWAEALKQQPREVPYEKEPQGESITWATDDSGFYTISEKQGGKKAKKSYLYFYQRNPSSK
jgi:hypothetical protein